MKKLFFNIVLAFIFVFTTAIRVHAVQFDLLVLPTNLFSVCDNYFCFPEVSNIIADDVISNLKEFKNINTKDLSQVRDKLYYNNELKYKTQKIIDDFAKNDKIDFPALAEIAKAFNVKSVLLINAYAANDQTNLRRNLWDILEITSAFKITYPFELKTNAVLTDCVNNLAMWSGKYTKSVSDTFGYYSASNQTQALSQLEKIKQYSYETISKNISQNVFMRFFPRDVRTFTVEKPKDEQNKDEAEKKFIPNALEHLSDPHLLKEFESETNKEFRNFGEDDYIFTF